MPSSVIYEPTPTKNLGIQELKKVSMIKKYHNHTLQTNPWHREEEPQNMYSNNISSSREL